MRILVGIVDQLIVTTSPSEPMLAIAAAESLNASDRTYLDAVMTLQQADSTRSHSRSRPQSELYTRLLWTLGRDKTSISIHGTFLKYYENNEWAVYAVRLSTFLQTLLGDDLVSPTAFLWNGSCVPVCLQIHSRSGSISQTLCSCPCPSTGSHRPCCSRHGPRVSPFSVHLIRQ
jgi:hypothetical protein